MSSKAITDKPEDRPAPGGEWRPFRESAPSLMREDEPTFARIIGIFGLFFVGLALITPVVRAMGFRTWIGPGWASFFVMIGIVGLLLHASSDKDRQIRRLYGGLGVLLLLAGIVVPLLPIKGPVGSYFWLGFLCLPFALLFLLAFLRHETDTATRDLAAKVLGGVGALAALVAFVGGNASANFLVSEGGWPYGLLLALVALPYLWAFISIRGTSDDLAYRAGLGIGALGLLVFLVALSRTILQPLFFKWGWVSVRPAPYLVPTGLLLMSLGLLYAGFAAALCSDNRMVVLARRELAAYFYSPIAYIVLFGLTVVGWWLFANFVNQVTDNSPQAAPLIEPIVRVYIIQWWPIICVIFIVPVLTMRLLSEERRSGTLEVLLTAPVDETSVVISKFLASLVFFLMLWVPWALFLVALRIEGGEPFDYRPLLSFFITLACSGAGFLAMGVFFSSVTNNQIASAVLTFAGMLALTFLFFVEKQIERSNPASPWVTVLTHMSFIDLWINALDGALVLKYLVFHVSAAVFWLFLSVLVLNARRWA